MGISRLLLIWLVSALGLFGGIVIDRRCLIPRGDPEASRIEALATPEPSSRSKPNLQSPSMNPRPDLAGTSSILDRLEITLRALAREPD